MSLARAISILALSALAVPAHAHFVLQAPANWMSQDSNGLPIKMPPCGNESGGMPTNLVTAFQTGQTISITINEVVPHPGHYRVALAADQGSLPADPDVTAGTTACGAAAIMSPPVLPVLLDDALDHTDAFTAPQTFTVTLPAGYTCNNCVLQVIEFMGNHGLNTPGGCFYHHCANISISDNPQTSNDGGTMVVVPDMMDGVTDAATTHVSDASATAPAGDMAHRPGAPSSGLPGCSLGGTGTASATLGALIFLLVGATLLPRVARRR